MLKIKISLVLSFVGFILSLNAHAVGMTTRATGTNLSGLTNYYTVFETDGSLVPGTDMLMDISGSNYFQYSEALGTAPWSPGSASVTDDQERNPLTMKLTADILKEDNTAGAVHYTAQQVSISTGNTYRFSVYTKKIGRNWIALSVNTSATDPVCYFNLATGTTGTSSSSVCRIFSVSGGWYLVSLEWKSDVTESPYFNITIGESDGDVTFDGTGIDSLYVFGAQLQRIDNGDRSRIYHPTTNTNKPQFDMSPSVSAPTRVLGTWVSNSGNRIVGRKFNAASSQYYSIASAPAIWNTLSTQTDNYVTYVTEQPYSAQNLMSIGDFSIVYGGNYVVTYNGACSYTTSNPYISAEMLTYLHTVGFKHANIYTSSNASRPSTAIACVASPPAGTTEFRIGANGSGGYFTGSLYYLRIDQKYPNSGKVLSDNSKILGFGSLDYSARASDSHYFLNTGGTTDPAYYCNNAQCPLNPSGSFSVVVVFGANSTPTTKSSVVGKNTDTNNNQLSWGIHRTNTTVSFEARSNDGVTTNTLTSANSTLSSPNILTHVYAYRGSGNSISTFYRSTSTVQTSSTMAGPILSGTGNFGIGQIADIEALNGIIRYIAIFDGVELTQDQHRQMNANYGSRLYEDPMHELLGLTPTFLYRSNQDTSSGTLTTPSGHVLTKRGIISTVDIPSSYLGTSTYVLRSSTFMNAKRSTPGENGSVIAALARQTPGGINGWVTTKSQATNLQTYSEELNRYAKVSSAIDILVDNTTSPKGDNTAEALVSAALAGDPQSRYIYNNNSTAITSGNKYTYSIFTRKGINNSYLALDYNTNFSGVDPVYYDIKNCRVISEGAGATGYAESYSDWCRISITATATASASSTDIVRVYLVSTPGSLTTSSTGSIEAYVWGAVLANKVYASTYVKTTTSSVTAANDYFFTTPSQINYQRVTSSLTPGVSGKFVVELSTYAQQVKDVTQLSSDVRIITATTIKTSDGATYSFLSAQISNITKQISLTITDEAGTTMTGTYSVPITDYSIPRKYKFVVDAVKNTSKICVDNICETTDITGIGTIDTHISRVYGSQSSSPYVSDGEFYYKDVYCGSDEL